jgi:hypothetical protein
VIVALAAAASCGAAQASETWGPYTAIETPSIVAPTTAHNGCGISAEVSFRCSPCSDQDTHVVDGCGTHPYDVVTYTWSATGGSFPNGNTGTAVTWKAPAAHGTYTVTVTVDDVDGHSPGSDNDPPKSASLTMQVIRLDKVRLYLNHYGTAYPYTNSDAFKTRAVVWATCGTQGTYCDLDFDESLGWWFDPGSEGPLEGPMSSGPPDTPFFTDVVSGWPGNWPSLSIEWTLMYQVASASDGYHNRVYSYPVGRQTVYYPNHSEWGDDNRTYNAPGLHRFRATATMHPGTSWAQSVTSRNKELAFDIRPRYAISAAGTEQRNRYVEWISANLSEPYEWGGHYFGGYDSAGAYAGGGSGYDGYGIDCSGLVSLGARRAGYNWPSWRQPTAGIFSDTYSSAVSFAEFDEGDVLDHPNLHVISCMNRYAAPNEDHIDIIHASGSAGEVVRENDVLISDWVADDYYMRRLRPY